MRLFFTFLSIAYIAGIFLLVSSPFVSKLAPFNPYSLLHIPLYGILTILLVFSFIPWTQEQGDSINPTNRFIIVGLIALIVAMADEINQAYIPGRDASITDVLLDLLGIIVVLFLFYKFFKPKHHLTN